MNITSEDVVEYLDGVHKYQNYYMERCVFHSPDNNPSLRVSDFGYKCLSCGVRGSLVRLYNEVSGRIVVKKNLITHHLLSGVSGRNNLAQSKP